MKENGAISMIRIRGFYCGFLFILLYNRLSSGNQRNQTGVVRKRWLDTRVFRKNLDSVDFSLRTEIGKVDGT
jgi:hypothetical protein